MRRIAALGGRGILPLVCLALAEALVVAPNGSGWLAFVKALSHGTARTDAYHWWTPDVSWWHNHYYSNKAPLLAFLVLPVSMILAGLGLQPGNPLAHVQSLAAGGGVNPLSLWPLILVGSTAMGFVLLVLVRNRAEKVEPGYGALAAVTVGAGTLLLPFSTLFFVHVLSAMLAFAAFAVLWRERQGEVSLRLVAAAGLLAGLAVVAEYPCGVVAVVLGGYAVARGDVVRRGAAYAGAVVAGVVPLLVYNDWAFGSPFHLSYIHAVSNTGNSGHDQLEANTAGFFGVSVPSGRAALDLLFQHRGLLSISPVLALCVVGLLRMAKRGWRTEAIVISAIFLAYLVYDAGYYLPYGGDTPGPRFLIATLPFLGVALAPAYRVARWPTAVLAVASTVMMLAATASLPLGNDDTTTWVRNVWHNRFTATILTHVAGWHGIAGFALVIVLVAAALALAYRSAPAPGVADAQWQIAGFALLSWLLVMTRAAPLLETGLGSLAVAVLVTALALTAVRVAEDGLSAAVPALLLVPVAAVLYRSPVWTLVLSTAVACFALAGLLQSARSQRQEVARKPA